MKVREPYPFSPKSWITLIVMLFIAIGGGFFLLSSETVEKFRPSGNTPTIVPVATIRPSATALVVTLPTPTPTVPIRNFEAQYASSFNGVLTLNEFMHYCGANCKPTDFTEVPTPSGGTAILFEPKSSESPCSTLVFTDMRPLTIAAFDPQFDTLLYVEPTAYNICRQKLYGRRKD